MTKGAYVGVGGAARKVAKPYVGVNNVARLVTKAYVGVNGVARLWWEGEIDDGTVTQVALGNGHALLLTSTGKVYSCGNNAYGQLGRVVANGSTTEANLSIIPGLSGVVQVAAGERHSLFLTSTGEVYSCGTNANGQLGRAVASGSATKVNLGVIQGVSAITQIFSGNATSFLLTASGQVQNCGENLYGQLGRTVSRGSATVVNLGEIPGLSGVVQVAGGPNHTCFRTSAGRAQTCGDNTYGQLGRVVAGASQTSANLGEISSLSGVACVAAGETYSLIALSSGQVHSCGTNNEGQLGRLVTAGTATSLNLGVIPNLSGVVQVDACYRHSLFRTSTGQVQSCGLNLYGQLGRIVETGRTTVINLGVIPGLSGVVQVATGTGNSFFITSAEQVKNCGNNAYGALGRVVETGNTTTVNLGEINFS